MSGQFLGAELGPFAELDGQLCDRGCVEFLHASQSMRQGRKWAGSSRFFRYTADQASS
jgi:hypothetical protein